ncbi:hypothetical protein D9615_007185 [Tricholomella constricta]|uniref:RBR-type E3 ubiquitin transferase n=1 Tax=Tricholomella constricta TaxID=117010 RepID=A0A8H5H8A6_9AGAR|nr:hypothetical protein D9615_007185 [Tricholomella constricta]
MASSSTLRSTRQPPNHILHSHNIQHDLDFATSKLIAELTLHDIAEISSSRKGKARADAPLSDEEIAFRMQRESWENAMREMADHTMARSLNDAIESDHLFLNALSIAEQAAEDDRRAALALSDGQELPPPSNAQRLLEDPTFSELAGPPKESESETPADSLNTVKGDDKSVDNISSSMQQITVTEVSKGKIRSAKTAVQSQTQRAQCTGCGEISRGSPYLKGPCGHDYCSDCITSLVDACTRDESLYPPRCCSQPFSNAALLPFLDRKLFFAYNIKRVELDVPAANRIFCPTPTCSAFLGSSEHARSNLRCSKCHTSVCSQCRQPSHPGENCSENQATIEVRELARAERWQTCPGCKAIVELNVGCYHITCRCRFQFCYLCAKPWKDCGCPQWNEDLLLDTAQQRVAQENVGRAPVAPIVLQEQLSPVASGLYL